MLKKSLWGKRVDPLQGLKPEGISYVLKTKRNFFKLPQMFWTSEIYSLGKAYRKVLGIPRWLYLPFYSDHGYSALGHMQPHEQENKSNIHITFNKYRYDKIRSQTSKKVIYYTHPYIGYRKNNGIELNPNAKGTLVFYSHTIKKVKLCGFDLEEYLNRLESLPDKYKPFVFIFHVNDILKGSHESFLKKGLPILTAGNQSNPYFIDRFYDIIRHFKYATSNSGGSELFYCTEMGIEYFIYGKSPKLINEGHEQNEIGDITEVDELCKNLNDEKRRLFCINSQSTSEEKIKFINQSLGIDSELESQQFRRLIYREYPKTFLRYIRIIYSRIISDGK
ncbi:MAG: hypothetical protein JXQ96_04305 [Cyclobacteriaceae bacterium]